MRGGGDAVFSTYEDSTIGGAATVNGYSGRWLGFLRNRVGGGVTLTEGVS